MPLALCMDQHISHAITAGLRQRGFDVLTAYDDGADQLPDDLLLERATALGRILFSQDQDLLIEARQRQYAGQAFGGIIYAHQLRISVGQCIDDLELIAQTCSADERHSASEFIRL
jgi:hypothetical protein